MPSPALETNVFLIHSEKYALREALEGHPSTPERDKLLEVIVGSGDHDSRIAFTEPQARFIKGTLVPWAEENRPFRGEQARVNMAIFLLGQVVSRLESPNIGG